MDAVKEFLGQMQINTIFAFNMSSDRKALPFLQDKNWCDIMDIALYKQYNKHIPSSEKTFSTGRIKRNGSVKGIMKMLSGDKEYEETHNALQDAMDELKIMQLLGRPAEQYFVANNELEV